MINIIINLKQNQIMAHWSDNSITWMPLNEYEFKENEDYSIVEQDGFNYGSSNPRIVKGSFLIALFKNLKKYIDK